MEIRLSNADIDEILLMFTGIGEQRSRKDAQKSFLRGILKRQEAEKNLLSICADYGLVKILQHLIKNHNFKIDQKLDSGRNALQEVLEQGRTHRAISLLSCGADLKAISERDFIQHICADGHFKAIDFWVQLKEFHEQLLWSGNSNFLIIDHYQQIFKLFSDNDNLDFNKQSYQTYGPPVTPASPIYFPIVENTWSTFLALLRYGVDPAKPAMGTFNTLQSSVVMVRPLFVATLLGPEYKESFNLDKNGAPSLFHLAALGKDYFMREKMWVYFDAEECKEDPEASSQDDGNHQRIILEILSRNLDLELDQRDRCGVTPLLLAVAEDNIVAAEWFEKKGADIMATTPDGLLPCT
jgi:hypothetical protein